MIQPYNNHILIDPIPQDTFVSTMRQTYQEIGMVIKLQENMVTPFNVGDKVMFDAWLAKKYPKEGTTDEFYWLVNIDNIVAYEKQVPEQSV